MKLPSCVPMDNHSIISIIVCCYDEAHILPEFHHRLMLVLNALPVAYEVVYVNDGSQDGSDQLLEQFCRAPKVRCLNLSRNFGKESAMSAGIDHAMGDAVLFIDADLQDPPELIPAMVRHWLAGYDIVNMQRSDRRSDTAGKRLSAQLYYKLMNLLVDKYPVPPDVSDFRLIGTAPLNALRNMPERATLMKGLVNWLGFRTIEIPYQRARRKAGESKWSPMALVDLAMEGVLAFSRKPLRWFSVLSLATLLLTGTYLMHQWFVDAFSVDHLILGALALVLVGVAMVGEYIGAALVEVKRRPLYFLRSTFGGFSRQLQAPPALESDEQERIR
ncbi:MULTISPECIES: glycosyltransferase family 2 protein [Pseudomonas]|uniref:Glycosyltransferase family 2 protein n=1 Tax=Pseudomonas sessilinigenes TaxID=658629 RepID=A0ABX8MJ20_9PSED|nr:MULTISPECIES: glycosyltransferase family 2 protein [Pseudomonas]QIH07975.1 glycosyltransferase family 2 protein [Pseudomonas sp. BIOMIG1BAC]QXH39305.1 glycosyltransferase family 2 protein [Pseudomonas sessilinigenes]UMZ09145.1 glycosyltransferase family 2 protein [Pseudomonas sp. MPFS]